jgi:hypothetical protein
MYVPLLVTTIRAAHFVAAGLLDERLPAPITLTNEGSSHSLFDKVAHRNLVVFLSFLAAKRDMRFLVTKSTACLATLRVLAAKLLVDFNRRTFLFVVTEWTF